MMSSKSGAPVASEDKAVQRVLIADVLWEIAEIRKNIEEFSGLGFVNEQMKDFAKVAILDLENRIKSLPETRLSTKESSPESVKGEQTPTVS